MDKKDFRKFLDENIMILDGAMGTQLQRRGMPVGVCPEAWCIEHPEVVIEIQKEYFNAGSQAVYTATFGSNRLKLEEYGLGIKAIEMNSKLASISRKAAGSKGLVAGDISTTGLYIEPFGEVPFERAVDIYKEQVKGLLQGGVDFFIIETMFDIQEARAALIAVKESCDLPACVTMTFNSDGRTLTGTDPLTALVTLQNLGADAVGCNCSTGPEAMLDIIRIMKEHAKIPLIAKPNAGMPRLINGSTVFDMAPDEFGAFAGKLIEAGANIIGGCCGTSPEYILALKKNVASIKPIPPKENQGSLLTSYRDTVHMGKTYPVAVIGERVNPTGKKLLKEDLAGGRTVEAKRLAMEQLEKGAAILDINIGMPGIDEKETMLRVVKDISAVANAPLCIDSSDPEVIEAALRIYPGRALVNSVSLESIKIQKLLPVAAKYGAMFILLPLDDRGIPKNFESRIEIIKEVYDRASRLGYGKEDILVDGMVMTVSSNQKEAMDTLEIIRWCSGSFDINTTIGLSNVSFGLPERGWINSAFFAMAIGNGLASAIVNPSNDILMNIKRAAEVISDKDAGAVEYIRHFSGAVKEKPEKKEAEADNIGARIFDAVLKGNKGGIVDLVKEALSRDASPSSIVDGSLIPAINQVGELFEAKKYFLPQLLLGAEAMKRAFEYLQPMLANQGAGDADKKVKIILATVKGDVHDIGKNIVGLMLRNHGFKVIDLGKDVSGEEIIKCAKENSVQIIGLSALMTTTMLEMKEVIRLVRQEGLSCKVMIGGAAVTQKYAHEIGADGYSEDANSAVKLARKLAGEN